MSNNISVVTSIIGDNRDLIIDEQPIDPLVDYVAFTTQNSHAWTIKDPCDIFKDDKKNAKIHKLLIHKYVNSDVNFWIDGNVQLLMPPSQIVSELLINDYDIVILETDCYQFNSTFGEGEYIIDKKMCYPNIVCEQLNKYVDSDLPKFMPNNKFMIRRNTNKCNQFNEAWWAENCRYSFRDQLSFGYILNKTDLKINVVSPLEFDKYFKVYPHKRRTY